jgi:hypothetical protein
MEMAHSYSSARQEFIFGSVITLSRFRSTQGCNREDEAVNDITPPCTGRISPKGGGISGQHGIQSAWILAILHLGITPTFLRLIACSPSSSGVTPTMTQHYRPPILPSHLTPRNDVLDLYKYCSNRQSNTVFVWPTAFTVNVHTS